MNTVKYCLTTAGGGCFVIGSSSFRLEPEGCRLIDGLPIQTYLLDGQFRFGRTIGGKNLGPVRCDYREVEGIIFSWIEILIPGGRGFHNRPVFTGLQTLIKVIAVAVCVKGCFFFTGYLLILCRTPILPCTRSAASLQIISDLFGSKERRIITMKMFQILVEKLISRLLRIISEVTQYHRIICCQIIYDGHGVRIIFRIIIS